MKHPPQEPDRVPGRTISAVAGGVVVATVIGVLVAYGIGRCGTVALVAERATHRVPAEVNATEMWVFELEAQGLEMNRSAAAYLSRYGWIDRDRGIVHIPIEAAFQVLLARQGGRP